MEVVWKAVTVILNCRFIASITYHDSIRGFRLGRGTETATLNVKMLQQVKSMREAVLHAIFLDLHKSYDALDRSRCLDILEVYGVGNRALRLLCRNCKQLQIVAWVGGYYREPFRGDIGVNQGDPLPPTISNVVMDAVVRHWESLVA